MRAGTSPSRRYRRPAFSPLAIPRIVFQVKRAASRRRICPCLVSQMNPRYQSIFFRATPRKHSRLVRLENFKAKYI